MEQFKKKCIELPFEGEQAVMFSSSYVDDYDSQHALEKNGMDEEVANYLAASRLQWLLVTARRQLSGRFDTNEMTLMMNCFQGDIFFPDMFNSIATAICEEFGVEIDELDASPLAPLVEKLRGLSELERVTLADALEQAWYRAGENGKTHFEVLTELGIEVK